MSDLRTAAQQALEALAHAVSRLDHQASIQDCDEAITALQAALGCDHCNSPLYAAIKCRVCGRETPIIEPEIKGDNKPVAWLHVPYPGNGMSPLVSLSQQREPSMYAASVPLYLKEQL